MSSSVGTLAFRRAPLARAPVAGGARMAGSSAWLGAAAGVLAMLAWQLPAAWFTPLLARASNGRVLVGDAQGSLWNGSAVLMLAGGPGSSDLVMVPGRLSWRLRPTWRAGLADADQADAAPSTSGVGLRLVLAQPCCLHQPAVVTIAPGLATGAVRLDALDWQVPASVLAGWGMPFAALSGKGRCAGR